jgi:hypothetical protein
MKWTVAILTRAVGLATIRSVSIRGFAVRQLAVLVVAFLLAGCAGPAAVPTPSPTLPPGWSPEPLRTFPLGSPGSPSGQICPAYAVVDPVAGTLAGSRSDPERVWLIGPSGRISVIWPAGFTLVFAPEATLYDERGGLFAHAGDTISLGQVHIGSHAGTPADPYLVAGLISATSKEGGRRGDCVPAADGTPYSGR